MSYEVMCICGQLLRGVRQRRHQVVPCAACGREVFILPASPLEAREAPAGAPPPSWLSSWGMSLTVGAASVVLLLGAFVVAWPYLTRRPPPVEPPASDEKNLTERISACQRLMAHGKFNLALRRLNAIIAERDRRPHLLLRPQHRWLNQLHRQADLLARLSDVSLGEIVRKRMLERDPDEWDALFARLRGRTFLFDDIVRRRDDNGRPVLGSYVVEVRKQVVRLALEDLAVLRELPLDESPRMLFGARLAGCELEEGGSGTWVIHFEADSGVLLTDMEAAEAASPVPLEPGLKETVQRQQQWVSEIAMVPPARP